MIGTAEITNKSATDANSEYLMNSIRSILSPLIVDH